MEIFIILFLSRQCSEREFKEWGLRLLNVFWPNYLWLSKNKTYIETLSTISWVSESSYDTEFGLHEVTEYLTYRYWHEYLTTCKPTVLKRLRALNYRSREMTLVHLLQDFPDIPRQKLYSITKTTLIWTEFCPPKIHFEALIPNMLFKNGTIWRELGLKSWGCDTDHGISVFIKRERSELFLSAMWRHYEKWSSKS